MKDKIGASLRNNIRVISLAVILVCLLLFLLFDRVVEISETRGLDAAAEWTLTRQPTIQHAAIETLDFQYPIDESHANVCMLQKPIEIKKPITALVYYHGKKFTEQQGMSVECCGGAFYSLRVEMLNRGWYYITPREYESKRLREKLTKEYGVERFIVTGASLGGKAAFEELMKEPDAWDAAVLMCPAMDFTKYWHILWPGIPDIHQPIIIITGENDGLLAPANRRMANVFNQFNSNFRFAEIPGGDHSAPVDRINWPHVLDFIESERIK